MAMLMIFIFIAGYLVIAFEKPLKVNKAATALVTGVLCWTVYILTVPDKEQVLTQLSSHLGEISQILFFLLGAMTIVELIDAHDGFEIITKQIKTTNKRKILWIVSVLAFFLSAILDNLTTTIVMVSLIRKLIDDKKDRWTLAGAIIIAANAGGVWSPIGDVTTTMLWIGRQITAGNIILKLFIPAVVCLLVSLLILRFSFKGNFQKPEIDFEQGGSTPSTEKQRNIVFAVGIIILLLVPIFKMITHLPPVMGILIGLGILWMITEAIHSDKDEEDRKTFTVAYALRKIDTSSILFFLGILLAIAALEATGQLHQASAWMDQKIGNQNAIGISIGVLSAVVDNVPLVAATQGMYSLDMFPTDHYFWELLAFTTGTGGSMLIIGSAAGIAAMGIEKIDFIWYLKKIGWIALIGFFAGVATYILQQQFL
ncbi:MAG: sodium:proton antiporter NhaD [Bacteroidetes bacterium]|nr:sodium:proton antiporter NhaD [Bacteroidota bacterium]